MKTKVIIALFYAFTISGAMAQKEEKVELNCYNKWAVKFEERGAEEIKDGVYTDVIITSRLGGKATCNSGKVEVLKGKVIKCYTLLSDGTYEEVKRTWKNKSNENVNIVGGISKSMLTVHNEIINVLWPSSMKAKRAKPIQAPEPTDD
jgi:Na+-transporting NADH:ubiquinone oxidoreductase subunit NqrF